MSNFLRALPRGDRWRFRVNGLCYVNCLEPEDVLQIYMISNCFLPQLSSTAWGEMSE